MDKLEKIITAITTLLVPLRLLIVKKYACDAEEYYGISKDNFLKIEINNKKYFILTLVCMVANLFMLKFVSNEEFSMEIDKLVLLASYIIFASLQVAASIIISKHLGKKIPIIACGLIFVLSAIIIYIKYFYGMLAYIKQLTIALNFCLFVENYLILLLGEFIKPETKKVYEILYPIKEKEIDYKNVLVKICENKKGILVCEGEIYISIDKDKSLINLNIKKPFYQFVDFKEYRYECIKFDNVNMVYEEEYINILEKNKKGKLEEYMLYIKYDNSK